MAKRVANTFVLVEDIAQQNLVRAYLKRVWGRNFNSRSIRMAPLPAGRGSGEKYVRDEFPARVKALRSSLGKRASAILIVMIDADNRSTGERHRQLEHALADAELQARSASEPIIVLIPKRNVETWIQALLGNAVDESDDYKRSNPTPDDFKNASATLYDWTRPNATPGENCPPSLSDAIPEWKRIPS
jgi:hypothetical protein